MNKQIRDILSDLEHVRENLLALSDDIWLSIDHNDTQAMKEGVAFKEKYNEKMTAFDKLSTDLSELVQAFTDVHVEEEDGKEDSSESRERIIKELDKQEPHSLAEDFTYKRPYGFVLEDQGYKEIVTWRRVYELFLKQLATRNPDVFIALCQNHDYHTNRGKPSFARKPAELRNAMLVKNEIYAEINLSANHIRDMMKRLLETFNVSESAMKVYLREDRDAKD